MCGSSGGGGDGGGKQYNCGGGGRKQYSCGGGGVKTIEMLIVVMKVAPVYEELLRVVATAV